MLTFHTGQLMELIPPSDSFGRAVGRKAYANTGNFHGKSGVSFRGADTLADGPAVRGRGSPNVGNPSLVQLANADAVMFLQLHLPIAIH